MMKKLSTVSKGLIAALLLCGSPVAAQEIDRLFLQGANPFSSDPGVAAQQHRLLETVESTGRAEQRATGEQQTEAIVARYAVQFYSYSPDRDSSDFSGLIQTIGAASSWQLPQTSLVLEAGFKEMMISPQEGELALNHLLSAGVRTQVIDNEKLFWTILTGLDLVFYDEEFDQEERESDFALNFLIANRFQFWIDNQQLTAGLSLQGLFATKRLFDLGVAVGWNKRLNQQFDLGAELAYHLVLLGALETYSYEDNAFVWSSVDYDSMPHALQLQLHGSYFPSDKLGLQLGYRIQLLQSDYSSHTLFVEGQFLF